MTSAGDDTPISTSKVRVRCPGTAQPAVDMIHPVQYWTHGPHQGRIFGYGVGHCSSCGKKVAVSSKGNCLFHSPPKEPVILPNIILGEE